MQALLRAAVLAASAAALDVAALGRTLGPDTAAVERIHDNSPRWLRFPGTFGETQWIHSPFGNIQAGAGPESRQLYDRRVPSCYTALVGPAAGGAVLASRPASNGWAGGPVTPGSWTKIRPSGAADVTTSRSRRSPTKAQAVGFLAGTGTVRSRRPDGS